ncbi:Ssf2p [Sugiyamaella lignohabitans]|uniref:Ssf2p n=1 Tax=Sugiyamaella lignohabitans TaxID=796027 RepID=A0A167FSV4_9ASCO|nr:Ssf2p [Sugiyamaella lignohabitans]ANB15662.1 Ssf2p [Sugiyamaella lignohabitans]
MEPHTASKLRERKSNRLKDFVVMAGPLGVSHLMIFSQSINGNTSLRIARTPRGPTLNFRIKSYSLCKDIQKYTKNPRSTDLASTDYVNPPLLVMNGFSTEKTSDKDALMTSMLQNMFPPINVQETKIGSIKRVMMINKDPVTGHLDIRHYAIDTKLVDVSRPVKKLSTVKTHVRKRLPNMSKASDIADYLLDPSGGGYTSESEVEDDATVEVVKADDGTSKSENKSTDTSNGTENTQTQKRAVKLVEIGPRLRLELRKIEDGLCEGKTLYHSYVEKTPTEIARLEKRHNERQELKSNRRKEQEENVRRKQELKSTKGSRTKRALEKAKSLETENEDQSNADRVEDAMDVEDEQAPEDMDDYDLEIANAGGESSESDDE